MSSLDQHNRLSEDLVAAYNTADDDAVARLNALFHSSINADQIRHFVRDRLMFLPGYEQHRFDVLTLADAQQLFASIFGFKDWAAFEHSLSEPPRDLRSASIVLSSTPPFFRIDWKNKSIDPCQPMSNKDWDVVFAVVKELGLTSVHANNMMGDEDLERLSQLDHVTSLDFDGSQFITDKGLHYLARMPQLRELSLSHRWNVHTRRARTPARSGRCIWSEFLPAHVRSAWRRSSVALGAAESRLLWLSR
ncbi:MAG TPA: hypothetical protein VLB46_14540 [Pyrinomonadaceae bacterium]|nr:hypothetical protein [Pyrinomonadaceae bacterium]